MHTDCKRIHLHGPPPVPHKQLYGVDGMPGMGAVPLGLPGAAQTAAAAALDPRAGGVAMYPTMVGAATAQGAAVPQYVMVRPRPVGGCVCGLGFRAAARRHLVAWTHEALCLSPACLRHGAVLCARFLLSALAAMPATNQLTMCVHAWCVA